jgi:hypothetical protein
MPIQILVIFIHLRHLSSRDNISEFDAKSKSPLPMFLVVLIQKYHRERMDIFNHDLLEPPPHHPPSTTNTNISSSLPSPVPLDSLSQFATFLAAVLRHQSTLPLLHMSECNAMIELLQILYAPLRHIYKNSLHELYLKIYVMLRWITIETLSLSRWILF